MAVSEAGILIADAFNHRVREIRWDGSIVTVAGIGVPGDVATAAPTALM